MTLTPNIYPGTYRGRAVRWSLSESSTGKEQVVVDFEFSDEPVRGQKLSWYGYFTEKTWERTVKSMRACGWTGTDLDDLTGMDANEVDLVVEHDTYEGKTRAKIAWVNAPGEVPFVQPLDAAKARSFAARMRGQIAQFDKSSGLAPKGRSMPAGASRGEPPPHTDSDMPPV